VIFWAMKAYSTLVNPASYWLGMCAYAKVNSVSVSKPELNRTEATVQVSVAFIGKPKTEIKQLQSNISLLAELQHS